ncbi:MAG TPA: CehA/McbA family metallohydrolase [Armatimonadota bacterium]|nr:CehA/McbA family metallohydrolase [Armatimonadota bacterium]HQK95752.1 CehA/McbA family metallohydrolase [Armatimonadota bacterium]
MCRVACAVVCCLVLCAPASLLAPASAADAVSEWSVQIVQPTAGTTLSAVARVSVCARPSEQAPDRLFVGLEGGPWVDMKPGLGRGQWVADLDTTLVPNGKVRLSCVGLASWSKKPKAKADLIVGVNNPLHHYFGDIHAHSSYSDGVLLPHDAYAYARDVSKLDFFCLTDHMELVTEAEWADMRKEAWAANQEGRFVTLEGLEWTKKEGHACVYEGAGRLLPPDIAGFYDTVSRQGALGMFNHPGQGDTVWNGLAFDLFADQVMQLMEVRTDDELTAYVRALKAGWHLAAAGTDDTHGPDWGAGFAWTGIVAPSLTRTNVMWALRERHCYMTRDRNCRLLFTANGTPMGTIIAEPVEHLSLTVSVEDPDATDGIASIELYEDGMVVASTTPEGPKCEWTSRPTPSRGSHFYFVRVKQKDDDALVSAPVWVTVR